jgi:hypothetical protein
LLPNGRSFLSGITSRVGLFEKEMGIRKDVVAAQGNYVFSVK